MCRVFMFVLTVVFLSPNYLIWQLTLQICDLAKIVKTDHIYSKNEDLAILFNAVFFTYKNTIESCVCMQKSIQNVDTSL